MDKNNTDPKSSHVTQSDSGTKKNTTGNSLHRSDLESIYGMMPGIFVILSAQFKIVHANRNFFKATNSSPDVMGKDIFLIAPPFPENDTDDYFTELKSSLSRVADELIPDTMRLRKNLVNPPDGESRNLEEHYFSYSNTPILNEEGTLKFIIHRAEDVTAYIKAGENTVKRLADKTPVESGRQTASNPAADHQSDDNYYPLILLINGQNETTRLMQAALEDSYRILTAADCDDGLHKLRKYNPALAVIDTDSPVDKISMLKSMHNDRQSANIPVLFAVSPESGADKTITKDNLTELLLKPYSSESIRAQVDTLLARSLRYQIEQSRLAAIVTSSEDAIIGANLDGTITDWNSGAEKIFGYTQKEIIGRSVKTLIPPEIHTDKNKIMYRIAQGERIQHLETIRMRKDGKRINVSTCISPIRNHLGRIIGASAITRDITRKKKIEQDMKAQAFLLEEMGQLAKVGGWEFNPETGKGAWTDEVARIHDLDPSEKATMEIGLSFFHGENRVRIESALGEAIEKGTPYNLELEMISAIGQKKWIRTICKPNVKNGKVISIRGAFQDITDLKQAELRALSSEKKLNGILEAISDALIVTNETGKIVMINSATEEMFGYTRKELLGAHADMLVPEQYREAHRTKCGAYFNNPDIYTPLKSRNIFACRSDDSSIPVDIALSLTAIEGNPHAVASIRDISRRKQAEDALKASETKFRVITENLKEMIYRADYKTFADNYVNKAVKEIYGYTAEEWLEDPNRWEKTIHPGDKDAVMDIFTKACREFQDIKTEYRVLDRKGKTHWVYDSMTWEKDDAGQPVAILGAMTDITEQKMAMLYIEEQEKFFRDVLQGIKAAILIIDYKKKVIVDVNTEFLNIVGNEKSKVIGSSCAQVLQCNEAICPKFDDKGNVIHGHIFRKRSSIINTGGERIAIEESFIPVTINGQKRVAAILFDVTEQEKLEHLLTNAQRLESIGQLAAGLAHEINTPIQYVAGNLGYLRDSFNKVMNLLYSCEESFEELQTDDGRKLATEWKKAKDAAELDFILEDIPAAFKDTLFGINQVTSIVKAMRKFSHPGSEETQFIDLQETIGNIITVARNEWKYCSEIITDFDPELETIACMPGSFNQAVLNLLVNAAHANAATATEGQKGTITITTSNKGKLAEITVSDTGAGIPPDIQNRIFDPFFTTKDVGKGTGQGLGIVHSVMQKHGGDVFFNTVQGKGTTFTLRFPKEPDDADSSRNRKL